MFEVNFSVVTFQGFRIYRPVTLTTLKNRNFMSNLMLKMKERVTEYDTELPFDWI